MARCHGIGEQCEVPDMVGDSFEEKLALFLTCEDILSLALGQAKISFIENLLGEIDEENLLSVELLT